jgi:hypothetical protein
MTQSFGEIVPFALVIALSPIPIVAVIAMLFSQRAIGNGLAFLMGWIVGVGACLAILTALAASQDLGTGTDPSSERIWIEALLGVALLAGAVWKWRSRPAPGDAVPMPGWMAKVDGIRPARAFGLAVVLAGLNPKCLVMNAAAAAVIAPAGLAGADLAIVIGLYTAVASSTVALAVLYRVFSGARGVTTLERVRGWLVANNAAVMAVLLLVFGVKLVGDAIAAI